MQRTTRRANESNCHEKSEKSDIEEFLSLPDSEKERIYQELEAETPQQRLANSQPLNARERAAWEAFRRAN